MRSLWIYRCETSDGHYIYIYHRQSDRWYLCPPMSFHSCRISGRKYLISVTGFDACSLQPTSGASGEYAGLLVIKKYLEAQGQGPVGVTKDYCETKGGGVQGTQTCKREDVRSIPHGPAMPTPPKTILMWS